MSTKSRKRKNRAVGNGQGSIYQDNQGRWRASLAWVINGQQVRKYRTRKTRREAEAALDDLKKMAGKPAETRDQQTVTMARLLRDWLETKKKKGLAEATLANYQNQISAHLEPAFAHCLAKDMTERSVEGWLDESSLGDATLSKCFIVLRGAFKYARKRGLIDHQPLELLSAPTWKREKEIKPFSRKEVSILLAAENHYQTFLRVMLSVGMRPGELAALRWCDIDFQPGGSNAEHGLIMVKRSRQENGKKVTFKEPKTSAGVRSIAMDKKLKQALLDHKEAQLTAGPVHRESLVFLTPHGKVIRKNNLLNHYWHPLLKRLQKEHERDDTVDFSPRVIYHCRHTAATLMLGAGVPVHVVAGILGHERISYTWDLYSHLLPEQQKAAVEARSDYL